MVRLSDHIRWVEANCPLQPHATPPETRACLATPTFHWSNENSPTCSMFHTTPLDHIWSFQATQIITYLRFDCDAMFVDTHHLHIHKSAIESAEMRFEQPVSKPICGTYLWLLCIYQSLCGLGYSKQVLDQSSNYEMVDRCHCEPLQPKWQLTFYDQSNLSNKESVSCLLCDV